jgi:CheY-like chemotaxis protein
LTRSDPRACVPSEQHRQTLPGLEEDQNVGRFDAVSDPRWKGALPPSKGDPATRDIPIIVITGSSLDERDAVAMGCDRLITKPVTAVALTAIVNALVDRVDDG